MFTNLLAKFLSDIPATFNYTTLEDDNIEDNPFSVFKLCKGKNKSTGAEVSVFVCKNDFSQPRKTLIARSAVATWKTLKHPGVITLLDAVDVPSGIYIATEPVTLLAHQKKFPHDISWGLLQTLETIGFLNDRCGMTFGSLSPMNLYLTQNHSWKLGTFETAQKIDQWPFLQFEALSTHPASSILFNNESKFSCYPELHRLRDDKRCPILLDMLGCLNICAWAYRMQKDPTNFSNISFAFQANKSALPLKLKEPLMKCLQSHPDQEWLVEVLKSPFFTESRLISIMSFARDLKLKGNWDKEIYLDKTLPLAMIESAIPIEIQINQLLPILMSEIGFCPPSLVPSIVKLFLNIVGNVENSKTFESVGAPILLQLFAINDRCVRFLLLQDVSKYRRFLTAKLADAMFDPLVSGLKDTAIQLREATLTVLTSLIPTLKDNTVRLTSAVKEVSSIFKNDPDPNLRSSALTCLVLLVSELPDNIISKHLAPEFLEGLKCRDTAILMTCMKGLILCVSASTPHDIAVKFLPAVCVLLVDINPQVRATAFRTVESLLKPIRPIALPEGFVIDSKIHDDCHHHDGLRGELARKSEPCLVPSPALISHETKEALLHPSESNDDTSFDDLIQMMETSMSPPLKSGPMETSMMPPPSKASPMETSMMPPPSKASPMETRVQQHQGYYGINENVRSLERIEALETEEAKSSIALPSTEETFWKAFNDKNDEQAPPRRPLIKKVKQQQTTKT